MWQALAIWVTVGNYSITEIFLSLSRLSGNLHLNVVAEGNVFSKEIQGAIEPFVYELVGTHYCDTTEQKCKSPS